MSLLRLYYRFKPLIPRGIQIFLRRKLAAAKRQSCRRTWPIDPEAAKKPQGWRGWPDQKTFALILHHDVDTVKGVRNCLPLMELDRRAGFRSAFYFVLEDYALPPALRKNLTENGFEVGLHGNKHDGQLLINREVFYRNAPRIDYFLKKWGAVGLTSPSMIRNIRWMAELDIEHGCSTFDTDPFEPQAEGVGTIFPFFAENKLKTKSYIELPYSLPQDHGLFVILKEKDIRIWKDKLDWIAANGGMALLNTHPDYMNFGETPCSREEYPVRFYSDFLEYVKSAYPGRYWHVLPRDMARFWRQTNPSDKTRGIPQENGSPPLIESRLIREKKKFDGCKAKIWIDLDNTPHVPFFIPIIRALEGRGHQVVLSARDAFQVCDLADKKNLAYVKIGRHYGKKMFRKLFGLVWRSIQLGSFYLSQKPNLALSHGSRSQALLCHLWGIPSVGVFDYEHAKTIPLAESRWIIVPEVLSGEKLHVRNDRIRYYRGIKEDVYTPGFKPDPSLPAELGLDRDELIVTVRPPANEAHYFNPESDCLLLALMARIVRTPGIRAVLLPRNPAQERALKAGHPEWFAGDKTIVPSRVVDGLDLLWLSDLVVSGGGTMNREAAALGVPVYSIFRGETGAVDRMLEREGRLTLIRNIEEIGTKIRFIRRDKNRAPDDRPREALEDIVDYIEEILQMEQACSPRRRFARKPDRDLRDSFRKGKP